MAGGDGLNVRTAAGWERRGLKGVPLSTPPGGFTGYIRNWENTNWYGAVWRKGRPGEEQRVRRANH